MTAQFPTAVHALVYLQHKGVLISSTELADNICTNPARIRKIMAKLHHAGLVESTEGRSSGYHAIQSGGEITLAAVAKALDEEPVAVCWRSGDVDRDCHVSSGMASEMDLVYGRLNELCMAELSTMKIGAINTHLFP